MKRLCVYCGSSTGRSKDYTDAAMELAETVIRCNIDLVFGGSSAGMMGLLADAVLAGGGTVHGVIPRSLLEKEVAHPGLTEMHVVESMHERKAMMAMLSDGFIALPGGFGTLEELTEILVERQLSHHQKPLVLVSPDGFWDPLLAQFERMVVDGLLKREYLGLMTVVPDAAGAIAAIEKSAGAGEAGPNPAGVAGA